jgi:hypothetical protein
MIDFINILAPTVVPLFIYASILGILVLIAIHFWGSRHGYYKKGNLWFDDIIHFSGGFLVSVFITGFIQFWPLILSLTFLVGMFWEIHEYYFGIYRFKKYGTTSDLIETRDTIEDLICDMAGCILWILILKNLLGL